MSDGIDFVEADFGETNAAGGAYHLNKSPEQWDKWLKRDVRSPIWPLFFLLFVFVAIAALPIVVEMAMPKPAEEAARAAEAEAAAAEQAKAQTAQQVPNQAQAEAPLPTFPQTVIRPQPGSNRVYSNQQPSAAAQSAPPVQYAAPAQYLQPSQYGQSPQYGQPSPYGQSPQLIPVQQVTPPPQTYQADAFYGTPTYDNRFGKPSN